MQLGLLDAVVFFGYFIAVVIFGLLVAARTKRHTAQDYFLASKKLPWYVVGASFIASNISTEHFIGMVGWSFIYGMALANWEWGNVITFSVLIWVFLPFYMRGNVATMPEYLDRRFNKMCRYIYAIVQIIGPVPRPDRGYPVRRRDGAQCILSRTRSLGRHPDPGGSDGRFYTIYGGLLSVAWADFLQYCLLMVGGIIVTVCGLYYSGGLSELVAQMPEKFIVFYPKSHEMVPWTGLIPGGFLGSGSGTTAPASS